jgi:hypothetical protein
MLVPGINPLPVTEMVALLCRPCGTVFGESVKLPSTGLLTAMDDAGERPPPGAGVNALIDRLPPVAWSATVSAD